MRVTVIHNALNGNRPDQEDTLVQARAVHGALESLGVASSVLPVTLNLEDARRQLAAARPDVVFNLVEELADDIRLAPMAPALLAHMGLPFTGSDAAALTLSGDKVLCKRVLAAAGVPSPAWILPDGTGDLTGDLTGGISGAGKGMATGTAAGPGSAFTPARYICKSVHEHASLGLDDDCVVHARSPEEVTARLALFTRRHGGQWFAERFVDGREFNVAMLESETGGDPQVLSPAEMEFCDFGPDRPKIVGYAAKWDESAFEYAHTVRAFPFAGTDAAHPQHAAHPLHTVLREAATACWHAFGLSGYARVDFRVDGTGTPGDPYVPYAIDVNTNPCIAPDAGLAAAAAMDGLSYPSLVLRVVHATLRRHAAITQPHTAA